MGKPVSWSYSALNSFETCPRKHYLTKVSKEVKEPENEAARWGNRVHEALESRVKEGTPLPTGMTQWEPMVEKLLGADGTPLAETKMTLNRNLEPVDWFAKDAWVRGIIDFRMAKPKKVLAVDWKTGKRKDDPDQLKLFAGMVMAQQPEVEQVVTSFAWLKEKSFSKPVSYTRGDIPDIWGTFMPRVRRLEIAHETGEWEPRPSGLCKRHCPCTSCEFNGQR